MSQFHFSVRTKQGSKDNARVLPNGTVYWTVPLSSEVTCAYLFRLNQWECPFEVGSWSYFRSELHLVVSDPMMHVSDRIQQDWTVSVQPAEQLGGRLCNLHLQPDGGSTNSTETEVWRFGIRIQKQAHQKGPRYG